MIRLVLAVATFLVPTADFTDYTDSEIRSGGIRSICGICGSGQGDPLDEYRRRSATLKASDAEGHYKLGLWCEEKKLADCAKREFEKTIAAKPGHEGARGKLGHREIDGVWASREVQDAAAKGVRFPDDETTRAMRARGPYYAAVIDTMWNRDRWAASLARIDERTGLFEGTLDVEVKFGDLGKVPAMGEGIGGKGTIWLDMKNLSEYEKTIDDFLKKAAQGGVVAVPPAKTAAIITHELAHCFQGQSQPSWFLEGMATWCAGDGHFVFFFRHEKQKVLDVEAPIDFKYVYARGWSFFEYLDARHGRDKLKQCLTLALRQKKDASEAVSEISGKEWAVVKKEERDWSARWISNYRSK